MTESTNLLQKAQTLGNPVIEGEQVTFVWEGDNPPYLLSDFNLWGADDSQPQTFTDAGDGIHTLTLTLPTDAYIEYALFTEKGDEDSRITDPLNNNLVDNGMDALNHYFTMPESTITPLADLNRDIPQGIMTRQVIKNPFLLAGGERDVWLYKPVATSEPTPLLVVYDGWRSLKVLQITQVIDSLIGAGKIPPLAVALIDSSRDTRIIEYMAGDAMVKIIVDELLPLAHEHLDLLDTDSHPGAYGVCGASMGGLMAFYTALRHPHIFSKALCQSPSLPLIHNDYRSPTRALLDTHDNAQHPIKIWIDSGTFEANTITRAEIAADLKQRGIDTTYQQFNGGHNNTSWRSVLAPALITLFGD